MRVIKDLSPFFRDRIFHLRCEECGFQAKYLWEMNLFGQVPITKIFYRCLKCKRIFGFLLKKDRMYPLKYNDPDLKNVKERLTKRNK